MAFSLINNSTTYKSSTSATDTVVVTTPSGAQNGDTIFFHVVSRKSTTGDGGVIIDWDNELTQFILQAPVAMFEETLDRTPPASYTFQFAATDYEIRIGCLVIRGPAYERDTRAFQQVNYHQISTGQELVSGKMSEAKESKMIAFLSARNVAFTLPATLTGPLYQAGGGAGNRAINIEAAWLEFPDSNLVDSQTVTLASSGAAEMIILTISTQQNVNTAFEQAWVDVAGPKTAPAFHPAILRDSDNEWLWLMREDSSFQLVLEKYHRGTNTLLQSVSYALDYHYKIAMDQNREFLFFTQDDGLVRKIEKQSMSLVGVTPSISGTVTGPHNVRVSGSNLWYTIHSTNYGAGNRYRLYQVNTSTLTLTSDTNLEGGLTNFLNPIDVAVDREGVVWVLYAMSDTGDSYLALAKLVSGSLSHVVRFTNMYTAGLSGIDTHYASMVYDPVEHCLFVIANQMDDDIPRRSRVERFSITFNSTTHFLDYAGHFALSWQHGAHGISSMTGVRSLLLSAHHYSEQEHSDNGYTFFQWQNWYPHSILQLRASNLSFVRRIMGSFSKGPPTNVVIADGDDLWATAWRHQPELDGPSLATKTYNSNNAFLTKLDFSSLGTIPPPGGTPRDNNGPGRRRPGMLVKKHHNMTVFVSQDLVGDENGVPVAQTDHTFWSPLGDQVEDDRITGPPIGGGRYKGAGRYSFNMGGGKSGKV